MCMKLDFRQVFLSGGVISSQTPVPPEGGVGGAARNRSESLSRVPNDIYIYIYICIIYIYIYIER